MGLERKISAKMEIHEFNVQNNGDKLYGRNRGTWGGGAQGWGRGKKFPYSQGEDENKYFFLAGRLVAGDGSG